MIAIEKDDPTPTMENSQIPVNTPLIISGMDEAGIRRCFVNVGPFAG